MATTTDKSRVQIAAESCKAIISEFGRVISMNAAIRLTPETHEIKGKLAREAAAIYSKEIEGNADIATMPMKEAIMAADFTDPQQGNVGLLSGTLVLQRALALLQFEYPLLDSIVTDFSDSPGVLKQTEMTRIVLKPAVQTYDDTLDTTGRPRGWVQASPAQTVDVPIKIDEYVAVPIVFGAQTLGATVRKLFSEMAPQALYALGGYMVDKLTALFTAANYNAYKGNSAAGGSTTAGSNVIGATSTTNMYVGQEIAGAGVPTRTYISEVTSSTAAKMTQNATATGSSLTFTLNGGRVPINYATYVKALANFDMSSLSEIAGAFDNNELPLLERFIMINGAYYRQLSADPAFNTFFAAIRNPEIISKGVLPELQGIMPQKAPWFPSSSNRVGFAYHKCAALLKTRLPQDFMRVTGAKAPGSVTTVTTPGGISVLLVQYIDLQRNYAEWRPEIMIGAAVGDRRAGLVITSA